MNGFTSLKHLSGAPSRVVSRHHPQSLQLAVNTSQGQRIQLIWHFKMLKGHFCIIHTRSITCSRQRGSFQQCEINPPALIREIAWLTQLVRIENLGSWIPLQQRKMFSFISLILKKIQFVKVKRLGPCFIQLGFN